MEHKLVEDAMRKKHGSHMKTSESVEIRARWQIGDVIYIAAIIWCNKLNAIVHHEILRLFDGEIEYTFLAIETH